eukprot:9553596-Alexandrium_andersonii.AAC.1
MLPPVLDLLHCGSSGGGRGVRCNGKDRHEASLYGGYDQPGLDADWLDVNGLDQKRDRGVCREGQVK